MGRADLVWYRVREIPFPGPRKRQRLASLQECHNWQPGAQGATSSITWTKWCRWLWNYKNTICSTYLQCSGERGYVVGYVNNNLRVTLIPHPSSREPIRKMYFLKMLRKMNVTLRASSSRAPSSTKLSLREISLHPSLGDTAFSAHGLEYAMQAEVSNRCSKYGIPNQNAYFPKYILYILQCWGPYVVYLSQVVLGFNKCLFICVFDLYYFTSHFTFHLKHE